MKQQESSREQQQAGDSRATVQRSGNAQLGRAKSDRFSASHTSGCFAHPRSTVTGYLISPGAYREAHSRA